MAHEVPSTKAVVCALAISLLVLAGCGPSVSTRSSAPPPAPRTSVRPAPKLPDLPPIPPGPPRIQEGTVEAPAPRVGESHASEIRGIWLHDPRGVNWDVVMRELRAAGLNSIFVKFSTAGAAYYRSQVLPGSIIPGRDEPSLCLAAAKRYGIAVHAWHVCFQMKDAPADSQARAIRERRVQQSVSGQVLKPTYHVPVLCPSNEANRALEKKAIVELATKYPFAGVQLDHIRWTDSGPCYCSNCRARFARETSSHIRTWPRDVLKGGRLETHFQIWREDVISSLMKEISIAVRSATKSVRLSADVFPDLEKVRRDKAQNWKLWVDRGWVDFVCPMNYTADMTRFAQLTANCAAQINGRVPLVVGIGAYKLQNARQLREQFALCRQYGGSGFVIFNYDDNFRTKFLPYLR